MASATMVIDVEMGPAMRTCFDVLELGSELLDLIPEWHGQERTELESRLRSLIDVASAQVSLNGKKCKPDR